MQEDRRGVLKQLSALMALSVAGPALAQQRGASFETLPNRIPSETPGKIEVIEFFHYGCPHCRDFHPLIQAWKKDLPQDVSFRAVPAIWDNEQLRGLARLYYAAERTGHLDQLEEAIFAAVQDRRQPLFRAEEVSAWVEGFDDIDAQAFMDTYNSFAIQGLVKRADQVARAYQVRGVPTMAVDGRYITSASLAGSHENALKVVDQLIEKARAES